MVSTVLDPTGWSGERIDSAIRRRMNIARELAGQPDSPPDDLARVNAEIDRLLDARKAVHASPAAEPAKLVIDGVEYEVPENLTLGETADLEEIVGDLQQANVTARHTLGIVWITLRRKDPSWTLDRVRELDLAMLTKAMGDASPPAGSGA